jgi:hypothetical protein
LGQGLVGDCTGSGSHTAASLPQGEQKANMKTVQISNFAKETKVGLIITVATGKGF